MSTSSAAVDNLSVLASAIFKRVDANSDGHLSATEFQSFLESLVGKVGIRQDVVQRIAPRVLRMDHDRQTGGVGRFACPVEGVHPGGLADDAVSRETDFDAQDDVAVLLDGRQRPGNVGVAEILQLADLGGQHSLRRDVELRIQPCIARFNNKLAETGKRVGARGACVHGRRHALGNTVRVRGNA